MGGGGGTDEKRELRVKTSKPSSPPNSWPVFEADFNVGSSDSEKLQKSLNAGLPNSNVGKAFFVFFFQREEVSQVIRSSNKHF